MQERDNYNPAVITPFANRSSRKAVLRCSAAILRRRCRDQTFGGQPALMQHTGRAVVFENIDDLHARIDDPEARRRRCVLVLKNCGPKGYPGFPEVGNLALPAKLLKKGVTDMIRISDARMSGTAYGTVVLHTAPEAAAGGPLALVQQRRFDRAGCSAAPVAPRCRRRRARKAPRRVEAAQPHAQRGWVKLYCDTVLQADEGVDLDFLVGGSGAKVARESH